VVYTAVINGYYFVRQKYIWVPHTEVQITWPDLVLCHTLSSSVQTYATGNKAMDICSCSLCNTHTHSIYFPFLKYRKSKDTRNSAQHICQYVWQLWLLKVFIWFCLSVQENTAEFWKQLQSWFQIFYFSYITILAIILIYTQHMKGTPMDDIWWPLTSLVQESIYKQYICAKKLSFNCYILWRG
jgi:hypothetical protein